jgi:hypothetical protein
MRQIKKLSPSSLHTWESDRELFYKKYLSDARPPWQPQSDAAAAGSAFDAFVKCNLHQDLFGNDGDGVFDLNTLFEKQVSLPEMRPYAHAAGQYAFNCYKTWGAYGDLLRILEKADDIRFEFEVKGEVGGVPIVGYPDLCYNLLAPDLDVVHDWKVTGFASVHGASPKKLYANCRDCWGEDRAKPTRGFKNGPKAHPKFSDFCEEPFIYGSHFMHEADEKWADQITIYAWLGGSEVGSEEFISCIDQLACKPSKNEDEQHQPMIRVAQHRCRVSKSWQENLLRRLQNCWETIHSGHIFDDLSREESDARCEVLDMPDSEVGHEEFWEAVNHREYRG